MSARRCRAAVPPSAIADDAAAAGGADGQFASDAAAYVRAVADDDGRNTHVECLFSISPPASQPLHVPQPRCRPALRARHILPPHRRHAS